MRINIKVKHLILTLLTLVLLVPLVSFVIIPQINLYLTEKRLTAGDPVGKEAIEALLNQPLFATQKWGLIQKSMLTDGPARRYDVYVGPSFTQTTTDEARVQFTWDEKLPYIKKYVEEGPVNGFLTTAAQNLAAYHAERHEWHAADKVLAMTAERFKEEDAQHRYDRQELELTRVHFAMQNHQLDDAEHLLDQLLDTMDSEDTYMQAETAKLKARLILQQGDVKEAHNGIQKALAAYEQTAKETERYDGDFSIENDVQYKQLQSLEWRLEGLLNQEATAASRISGIIKRADGEPLKHAGVFLRAENVVNQSVSQEEPYQTVTDEDGTYEFQGVIPGDYQIVLGFDFDQIDGWTYPVQTNEWVEIEGNDGIRQDITLQQLIDIKSPVNQTKITDETVTFAWEEVADAAYYNLNINVPIDGGSIGRGVKTHITSTETHLTVEELYHQSFNILLGEESDGVDPLGLLGLANPESRFSWNVEAFDQAGNLLSRSNGYRLNEDTLGNLPFFYLETRELTKADRMLLKGDIKEALNTYMAEYEKHPEDLHNVRMIVRLLGMKGDGTTETRDELVVPYVKVLAEETGAFPYIRDLLSYYYDQRDWAAFERWYQRAEEAETQLEGGVIEAMHAKALLKQGEFEAAHRAFAEAVPLDLYHTDTGNWLAVALYQGVSFNELRQIAADYPEYDTFNKGRPWKQLIEDIQAEAQGREDAYLEKIHTGLGLYFKGENDKLEKWLKKVREPALTEFVEQLGELK